MYPRGPGGMWETLRTDPLRARHTALGEDTELL